MKKIILALTLGSGLAFGMIGVANAAVPSDVPTGAEKATNANKAPTAYEKYGFGQVNADGHWVNDSHSD